MIAPKSCGIADGREPKCLGVLLAGGSCGVINRGRALEGQPVVDAGPHDEALRQSARQL